MQHCADCWREAKPWKRVVKAGSNIFISLYHYVIGSKIHLILLTHLIKLLKLITTKDFNRMQDKGTNYYIAIGVLEFTAADISQECSLTRCPQ